MVSFQAATLSPSSRSRRNQTPEPAGNSSRKRKWEEDHGDKTDHPPQPAGISLNLQPNYAMKSANLDTQPLISPQPEPLISPLHMSLDLELNLPCGSTQGGRKYHAGDHHHNNTNHHGIGSGLLSSTVVATTHDHLSLSFGDHDRLLRKNIINNPVLVSVENGTHDHHDHDHGWDQREMVAAVCKKCHMLVMMFKASPACPNCKFMHPLDQSPPNLFKRGGGGGLARSCVTLWN